MAAQRGQANFKLGINIDRLFEEGSEKPVRKYLGQLTMIDIQVAAARLITTVFCCFPSLKFA